MKNSMKREIGEEEEEYEDDLAENLPQLPFCPVFPGVIPLDLSSQRIDEQEHFFMKKSWDLHRTKTINGRIGPNFQISENASSSTLPFSEFQAEEDEYFRRQIKRSVLKGIEDDYTSSELSSIGNNLDNFQMIVPISQKIPFGNHQRSKAYLKMGKLGVSFLVSICGPNMNQFSINILEISQNYPELEDKLQETFPIFSPNSQNNRILSIHVKKPKAFHENLLCSTHSPVLIAYRTKSKVIVWEFRLNFPEMTFKKDKISSFSEDLSSTPEENIKNDVLILEKIFETNEHAFDISWNNNSGSIGYSKLGILTKNSVKIVCFDDFGRFVETLSFPLQFVLPFDYKVFSVFVAEKKEEENSDDDSSDEENSELEKKQKNITKEGQEKKGNTNNGGQENKGNTIKERQEKKTIKRIEETIQLGLLNNISKIFASNSATIAAKTLASKSFGIIENDSSQSLESVHSKPQMSFKLQKSDQAFAILRFAEDDDKIYLTKKRSQTIYEFDVSKSNFFKIQKYSENEMIEDEEEDEEAEDDEEEEAEDDEEKEENEENEEELGAFGEQKTNNQKETIEIDGKAYEIVEDDEEEVIVTKKKPQTQVQPTKPQIQVQPTKPQTQVQPTIQLSSKKKQKEIQNFSRITPVAHVDSEILSIDISKIFDLTTNKKNADFSSFFVISTNTSVIISKSCEISSPILEWNLIPFLIDPLERISMLEPPKFPKNQEKFKNFFFFMGWSKCPASQPKRLKELNQKGKSNVKLGDNIFKNNSICFFVFEKIGNSFLQHPFPYQIDTFWETPIFVSPWKFAPFCRKRPIYGLSANFSFKSIQKQEEETETEQDILIPTLEIMFSSNIGDVFSETFEFSCKKWFNSGVEDQIGKPESRDTLICESYYDDISWKKDSSVLEKACFVPLAFLKHESQRKPKKEEYLKFHKISKNTTFKFHRNCKIFGHLLEKLTKRTNNLKEIDEENQQINVDEDEEVQEIRKVKKQIVVDEDEDEEIEETRKVKNQIIIDEDEEIDEENQQIIVDEDEEIEEIEEKIEKIGKMKEIEVLEIPKSQKNEFDDPDVQIFSQTDNKTVVSQPQVDEEHQNSLMQFFLTAADETPQENTKKINENEEKQNDLMSFFTKEAPEQQIEQSLAPKNNILEEDQKQKELLSLFLQDPPKTEEIKEDQQQNELMSVFFQDSPQIEQKIEEKEQKIEEKEQDPPKKVPKTEENKEDQQQNELMSVFFQDLPQIEQKIEEKEQKIEEEEQEIEEIEQKEPDPPKEVPKIEKNKEDQQQNELMSVFFQDSPQIEKEIEEKEQEIEEIEEKEQDPPQKYPKTEEIKEDQQQNQLMSVFFQDSSQIEQKEQEIEDVEEQEIEDVEEIEEQEIEEIAKPSENFEKSVGNGQFLWQWFKHRRNDEYVLLNNMQEIFEFAEERFSKILSNSEKIFLFCRLLDGVNNEILQFEVKKPKIRDYINQDLFAIINRISVAQNYPLSMKHSQEAEYISMKQLSQHEDDLGLYDTDLEIDFEMDCLLKLVSLKDTENENAKQELLRNLGIALNIYGISRLEKDDVLMKYLENRNVVFSLLKDEEEEAREREKERARSNLDAAMQVMKKIEEEKKDEIVVEAKKFFQKFLKR